MPVPSDGRRVPHIPTVCGARRFFGFARSAPVRPIQGLCPFDPLTPAFGAAESCLLESVLGDDRLHDAFHQAFGGGDAGEGVVEDVRQGEVFEEEALHGQVEDHDGLVAAGEARLTVEPHAEIQLSAHRLGVRGVQGGAAGGFEAQFEVGEIAGAVPGHAGQQLKAEDGGLGIYLCGGSAVAGALVDEIDELIIKTYPIVLGTGMPMFGSGFAVSEFTLDEVRSFDNGVLVRTYSRKR